MFIKNIILITFLTIILIGVGHINLKANDPMPLGAPAAHSFSNGDEVDLFTGDIKPNVNLITLPGRNGLDLNIRLSYNSNRIAQHLRDTDYQLGISNADHQASWVGLGWEIGFGYIRSFSYVQIMIMKILMIIFSL